ncbi:unnamed protein product [Camellia sinensis]
MFFTAGFSVKVRKWLSPVFFFCGPHFPASHYYTREYVQKYPFIKVDDVPFDDVPNVIGNYDICIVKSMWLDANVISHATRMKLIMQYGVGLEGVDINTATKHGIKVARIPSGASGNAASCAEMVIYLMLGVLRKNEMQIAVKQKKHGDPVGETLLGKAVSFKQFSSSAVQSKRTEHTCIGIHYGIWKHRNLVGKALATIWCQNSSYKMELGLVFAKFITSSASLTQNGMNDDLVDDKGFHEDIHTFASNADIVICCLLMNSETGALLVNIARGGLLDYEAILYHLKSGHLGGLGMDVAWTEPFDPEDPILKFPNVLITPHVAAVTEHAFRSMAKVVGNVALQLHAGSPLTGIEFVN